MFKHLLFAAAAASLGIATSAHAAVVTFTLALGQDNGGSFGIPGQWTLYADDSVGDNFGIVAMGVSIHNVATIINDMPRLTYVDSHAINGPVSAGFPSNRASDPLLYPNGVPLTGNIDLTAARFVLLTGFGQTSGTFPSASSLVPNDGWNGTSTATQTSWNAHLQIAHGTYNISGPLPDIDPASNRTGSNVLLALPPFTNPVSSQGSTIAAQIHIVIITPEPASLAILAPTLLTLTLRRRKSP